MLEVFLLMLSTSGLGRKPSVLLNEDFALFSCLSSSRSGNNWMRIQEKIWILNTILIVTNATCSSSSRLVMVVVVMVSLGLFTGLGFNHSRESSDSSPAPRFLERHMIRNIPMVICFMSLCLILYLPVPNRFTSNFLISLIFCRERGIRCISGV